MDGQIHLPSAAASPMPQALPRALLGFAGDSALLAAITILALVCTLTVLRWSGLQPLQQPLLVMSVTFAAMTLAAWPLWRQLQRSGHRRQASLLRALRIGLLTGLCAFAFSIGKRVLELQFFDVMPDASNIAPVMAALSAQLPFALLLFIVLAPWVEELTTRRVLLGRMQERGWPRLGLVLSASLFAWLHEPMPRDDLGWGQWLWLLSGYWGLGLLFAWAYLRTRSLTAAFTAHAVNNALAIGVLWWRG